MTKEEFDELQDIEEKIADITMRCCNYECECYDNGVECLEDCPVLLLVQELQEKAQKLLNNI
ncbi:MAG: hypothetical protein II661_09685 [Bacteroidales bacterium]|nr:hypothetical protein [Bacteroidales bacterium]